MFFDISTFQLIHILKIFLKQTMFITITDFRFTIECPCIECLMLEREWSSVFNVIVTVKTFKMVFFN